MFSRFEGGGGLVSENNLFFEVGELIGPREEATEAEEILFGLFWLKTGICEFGCEVSLFIGLFPIMGL